MSKIGDRRGIKFGGTRGGGKTDGVLGKWALKESIYGSAFNAIMFRKTTVSAEDAICRRRGGRLFHTRFKAIDSR
jgi:hypothetical protein